MTVEERLDELEAQVGALNLMVFAAFSCLKPDDVLGMLSTVKSAFDGNDSPKAAKVQAHIATIEDMFRNQLANTKQILLG